MIFIYGEEEYLVNLELKKALKEVEDTPSFYSDKDDINNIIMDATTVSIFDNQKTIVIKNHELFEDDKLAKHFVDEIKYDKDNFNLICVYEAEKLKKSNPLIAFLLENALVVKKDKINPKEIISTIKSIVESKGGFITNGATIKLAGKLPDNLRIIVMEVEKLLLENKEISEEMVERSIGDYLSDDYFALTNAIISGDKREIVSAYREKLEAGDTVQLLIGQIASTLNLAMLVASYKRQGLSTQDISDALNIHIFRVKKASELLAQTGSEEVENLIIALAKLDKDIKTGLIDEEKGMDYFILQLIK